MNAALDLLRRHPVFGDAAAGRETVSSGIGALDRLLPGGGWPLGALVELLAGREGVGELRLLMPVLARLSRQGRRVAWISPPHWPYGPALAAWGLELGRVFVVHAEGPTERLWAAEQSLRSGACGAVVSWIGEADDRSLRRLQLAAEKGRGLGVLFRPPSATHRRSPARLRLAVEGRTGGLEVRMLKGHGEGQAAQLKSEELLQALPRL